MGQYEKAEEDFKNLEKKQSQLVKERQSINKTIADLDEKKKVALSVIAQLKTKMAKYVHSLNIIVLKLHHF